MVFCFPKVPPLGMIETVDENLQLDPKITINKKIYLHETGSLLSAQEVVLLAKFHSIMTKNVDFLLQVNFKHSHKFSSLVSSIGKGHLN